jgi:hypothetical protein
MDKVEAEVLYSAEIEHFVVRESRPSDDGALDPIFR